MRLAAKIVMDRGSGRSKGFGFVTYASEEEAEKAVSGMNGKVKLTPPTPVDASLASMFD